MTLSFPAASEGGVSVAVDSVVAAAGHPGPTDPDPDPVNRKEMP